MTHEQVERHAERGQETERSVCPRFKSTDTSVESGKNSDLVPATREPQATTVTTSP